MNSHLTGETKMRIIIKRFSPMQIILLAFLFVIFVGSILLALPISSATSTPVSYIDALFTATTSVCVTGLVTLTTVSTWSTFGQVVILVLIQIGGMGVITVVAGLMLLLNKRVSIEDRILIGESFNLNSLDGIIKFVKKVIKFSLFVELIGALLYMTVFIPEFGVRGVWISVFTSVSAFCNAGIDIIAENSLCNFVLNPVVNITTILLIVIGGIGFIVLLDLQRVFARTRRTSFKFLSLHTKIVLVSTVFLIVSGTLLFLFFEYENPNTIKSFTLPEKIMVSLFQSVTTRTAGFATIPQENLTAPSALVSILLMFIGGSPAGTAGGIKTVTMFVLIFTAVSVIKNKRTVDVFNRQLSIETIKKALAVFSVSSFIVIFSTVLLLSFEQGTFLDVLFETVSAVATVGLTRNFTGTLGLIGKLIIIITMYLGRVGPISLAFAFNINKSKENLITNPVENISVG